MATLAVRKGVLTSPGATGNQTVSLTTGGSWPASTTPKAVILWTSYATAAGQSGISAQWSHGFGTNDASAVQNAFVNWNSLDAAAATAVSWGCNTTFILRGMTPSTTGTTEDYAATLVSLGSDQFVINWSNLPATASLKVHYLALGGDALSRARVFSFTGNNAATHDITVVASGGQPKVVFIAGGGGSGLTNGASGAGNCGIGVGLLDGTSRCSWLWSEDSVAAMNVFLRQINQMIVARGVATAGSTVIDQATMSSSSHPTDGFELTNSNAFSNSYVGLALYGTDLEVALGTLDSSTSTNGTDTIALGTGDAEAAFIWGGNMPTSASDISADNTALLGAWGIGAADSDGNEGHASIATDDAAADEQSGQTHSETKGIQTINPGATPALMGEADLTMSGSTLTATWTDADNVSREKNVLLLGAVGGATPADLPLETAAGQAAATLALKAQTQIPLSSSPAQSNATLALRAPTQVQLGTVAAQSAATLALRAPTQVPLQSSAAQSSATLALRTPAILTLGAAAAQSAGTLALTAQTKIPLGTATAVSTGSLAGLFAPGEVIVPLETAAAVSTGTLALSAQTQIALGAAAGQSAATLALTAPTRTALGSAAAQSTATLSLTAQTRIPLGTAASTSTGTLALTAQTRVALGTSAAQSSATLALTAQTYIPFGTATGQSSASLVVITSLSTIPLQTAAAQSSATLALRATTRVALDPAAAQSTGTLEVRAATRVLLGTSTAGSSASLTVFTPTPAPVPLDPANATSTGTLVLLQLGQRWPPSTSPPWGTDSQVRWDESTDDRWAVGAGTRWPVDPQQGW